MVCRRLFSGSTSLALALSWSLASGVAVAQTSPDTQAADRAFNEALTLMDSGRFAEACPKLEVSQRLAPASGTLLNLGDCYEHLGRIGSAWRAFEDAAARAKAGGKHERERVARERAAALVPRLSRILFVAPSSSYAPGELHIMLDNVPVPGPVWGAPVVVDAGLHTLVVRAPGRQPFSTTLGPVAEGETVSFLVPPLPPAIAGTASVGNPSQAAPSRIDGQRVAALVSAGIGAGGLVAGTAFGLHSMSKHDESDQYCEGLACDDPRGVIAMQDARTAGNRATAAFIVGGVGLAAASVLWFVRPFSSVPAAQAEVGLGVNAVLVRGRF
jgi:hypothetical protein